MDKGNNTRVNESLRRKVLEEKNQTKGMGILRVVKGEQKKK